MDDESTKASVRKLFTHARIVSEIYTHDKALAKVYDSLYERVIDLGAHPNEMQLTGNMVIDDTAEESSPQFMIMQGDGIPLELGLKTTINIGVFALEISQFIFDARDSFNIANRLNWLKENQ